MADLNKEMIDNLSRLCRINCKEEEKEALLKDLQNILQHIEQLNEVNTENVTPCYHVNEEISNFMREDKVGELLKRELFLENAPSHVAGMVKVPTIIKQAS